MVLLSSLLWWVLVSLVLVNDCRFDMSPVNNSDSDLHERYVGRPKNVTHNRTSLTAHPTNPTNGPAGTSCLNWRSPKQVLATSTSTQIPETYCFRKEAVFIIVTGSRDMPELQCSDTAGSVLVIVVWQIIRFVKMIDQCPSWAYIMWRDAPLPFSRAPLCHFFLLWCPALSSTGVPLSVSIIDKNLLFSRGLLIIAAGNLCVRVS